MDTELEKSCNVDEMNLQRVIKDLDKMTKKLNDLDKDLKNQGLQFFTSPDAPIKF